jgi:hypothetical protein
MLTKAEKITNAFLSLDLTESRAAWIKKIRGEKFGLAAIVAGMVNSGFEVVNAGPDDILTRDGREIIRVGDAALALNADEHIKRRDAALKSAVATKRATAKPGESLSSVLCPSCQSVMAKSPVCPNCSKGKAGFKILCICSECHHEVYL